MKRAERMEYCAFSPEDYAVFRELANAYYREGEDADTPQEQVDAFIRFLFERVMDREISGCLAKDGSAYAGFAMWGVDKEGFAFSEMPGWGTILEIGLIPEYRACGQGKAFVAFIENCLRSANVQRCYVSAYGPAQGFWAHCGYTDSGKKAGSGLTIMIKSLE